MISTCGLLAGMLSCFIAWLAGSVTPPHSIVSSAAAFGDVGDGQPYLVHLEPSTTVTAV